MLFPSKFGILVLLSQGEGGGGYLYMRMFVRVHVRKLVVGWFLLFSFLFLKNKVYTNYAKK